VAVVAAVLAIGLVRRSFPQTSGEITVSGLTSSVSVLRDDRGVPQIYADNADDLFRAQGYVAAQDRFFEMDLRRHITAGRLSELVGPDGLETDRVIRTMGWRRVAEQELPRLDPSTQRYLRAYADGVNAYLDERDSQSKIALEYVILGQQVPDYRIEPWTPVDSLAWLKAMAWDLRSDYADELTRARLADRMSAGHIADLFPPYDAKAHRPILSSADWSPTASERTAVKKATATSTAGPDRQSPGAKEKAKDGGSAQQESAQPAALTGDAGPAVTREASVRTAYAQATSAVRAVPATLGQGDGIGSNSWVVDGEHSTTGMPLLANDPHLGVSMPGIWYQTGLHCRTLSKQCPFDVSGFSFAGLPGIVIGHNDTVAWGFTNLAPDVTDFYLEKVRGDSYLRDGRYVPLRQRTETIKVAGQKDEHLIVRGTVHGPVMSDVVTSVNQAGSAAPVRGKRDRQRYEVSLAWTALQPNRTADAIFELNAARNWPDFRAAARDFAVPAQNLVYADTSGHIGYQAPGRVPIRRSATPGSPPGYWPAPGWDPAYDWKGQVPFEQLPHVLDPKEGFLVTANQEVTASSSPFLTTEWDAGYRSQRIRNLLQESPKVSPERMGQIQMDTRNDFAPVLVKQLLAVDLGGDRFTEDGQRLLEGWDYTTPASGPQSSAAAYYNVVWARLLNLTFDDELPRDLWADGGDRDRAAMVKLLTQPRNAWWDNKLTPGVVEGRSEVLRQAMVEARLELTRSIGRDPSTWSWGRLHQLELKHQVLGGDGVPGIVRALFNRGSWQMPGGSSIVDANGWDASEGFDVSWAPSMRMVVDLGDLDASRWVNQSGNSGHPYADHYDDQVDAWISGDTYPWPSTPEAVRAASDEELTLRP
jgi:penicillin amidase